ncbi:hypothetical protein I6F35_11930 [Bradyrhizobium sp. BRP22]|uniref:hypothetical protein n=1 Tax=Bradyrhizobium sp. BRP22 TaxID=2793821 RepID=UPI001CD7A39A|nr:hypothetical protein [Bradyrhizobium sp. BRP22]MCA1453922.1 hypothetical protein [Bradyrhizobium sp. BRP22]
MIHQIYSRKGFALLAIIVVIGFAVALFSAGGLFQETVASASLGPGWQCSRIAFVMTTCTKDARPERARVQAEQRSRG